MWLATWSTQQREWIDDYADSLFSTAPDLVEQDAKAMLQGKKDAKKKLTLRDNESKPTSDQRRISSEFVPEVAQVRSIVVGARQQLTKQQQANGGNANLRIRYRPSTMNVRQNFYLIWRKLAKRMMTSAAINSAGKGINLSLQQMNSVN